VAHQSGQLQGEDRDSPRALQQHQRTWLQAAQPVPGGQGSTGKGRGFLPAQVGGNVHQRFLVESGQLLQGAGQGATQRAPQALARGRTGDPGGAEDRAAAIAHLHPLHLGAHLHHFPGGVRAGNQRQRLARIVGAADHQVVAIVERHRAHRQPYLVGF